MNANKIIDLIAGHVAFGGAVVGSVTIASNIGLNAIAYVFFLASSIASIYLLRNSTGGTRALLYQSTFFAVVNVYGLVRHL